jgi:hypothetical protein
VPTRQPVTALWLPLVLALALGAGACSGSSSQSPASGEPSPAPVAANDYRLAAGGEALRGTSGERLPVDPKLVTGYVDAAVHNGEFVDLSGWAAPADLSSPAEAVLAVGGREAVVAVEPSGERPDLVEGYNRPGLERSGFAMSVPVSSLDCSAPSQGLKIFAVANGAAGRLEWLGDVGQRVRDACRGNDQSR